MKMRQKRKQFWWAWHYCTQTYPYYSRRYGHWDMGIARIKHQLKDSMK